MNNNNENENLIIAREISHKFEFYFLALVFTILGFSLQTASFTKNHFQYIFEIVALLSFLISGLAGLSRIEWLGVAFRHSGAIQDTQKRLDIINQGLQGRPIVGTSGKPFTEEKLLKEKKDLDENISGHKKRGDKVDESISLKYMIHKICFILGIICLTISRILFHIQKINL